MAAISATIVGAAFGSVAAQQTVANQIPSRCTLSSKNLRVVSPSRNISSSKSLSGKKNRQRPLQVQARLDIQNDPIVKEALKEPVAFLGGVFAGLLRLDLNEDPLKEWVAKTAEAAGIVTEDPESTSVDDVPSEIEIE